MIMRATFGTVDHPWRLTIFYVIVRQSARYQKSFVCKEYSVSFSQTQRMFIPVICTRWRRFQLQEELTFPG